MFAATALGVAFAPGAAAWAAPAITERNFQFLDYPDFPDAHSSWGSIGYSERHDTVFIGVTNHHDRVALYEYPVAQKKLRQLGFIGDLGHLRAEDWQGKIHSYIVEGPDGGMYFATDGGELRQELLMDDPAHYRGGFFFKWDPERQELLNLGKAMPYDSIKNLALDPTSGVIHAVTYPQAHFVTYDPRTNAFRDHGRMTSAYVPRVLFSDRWGNAYYVDWRQRLVKYETAADRMIFARESLPAFAGTPGFSIVSGLTACVAAPDGTAYLVTYGAKLLAFHPTREGLGAVEDLGAIYEGTREPWDYWCRSLALGRNGKLYYFVGGRVRYTEHGPFVVMMEFDPATRRRRELMHFPLDQLLEVPGIGVTDHEGNLYFAARRTDARAAEAGDSGSSVPVLMIFNPEKELKCQ